MPITLLLLHHELTQVQITLTTSSEAVILRRNENQQTCSYGDSNLRSQWSFPKQLKFQVIIILSSLRIFLRGRGPIRSPSSRIIIGECSEQTNVCDISGRRLNKIRLFTDSRWKRLSYFSNTFGYAGCILMGGQLHHFGHRHARQIIDGICLDRIGNYYNNLFQL